MPARKTTTSAVVSAARSNIRRAQVSRIRSHEPRSLGRSRTGRKLRTR
jgi:hypothetical protein